MNFYSFLLLFTPFIFISSRFTIYYLQSLKNWGVLFILVLHPCLFDRILMIIIKIISLLSLLQSKFLDRTKSPSVASYGNSQKFTFTTDHLGEKKVSIPTSSVLQLGIVKFNSLFSIAL